MTASNKLYAIRQTLVRRKHILFPDKVGKYTTDKYGIRRDTEEFKRSKANKAYGKAN